MCDADVEVNIRFPSLTIESSHSASGPVTTARRPCRSPAVMCLISAIRLIIPVFQKPT
jgi:hypothetical protein